MQTLSEKKLELWKSDSFRYMQGIGVTGIVNGKSVVAVVLIILFKTINSYLPLEEINQDAETVNFISIDDVPGGYCFFSRYHSRRRKESSLTNFEA